MLLVKSQFRTRFSKHSFITRALNQKLRELCISSSAWNEAQTKANIGNENENLEALIAKYEPKLLYNSIIEKKRMKFGFKKNNSRMQGIMRYQEKLRNTLASVQPLPLSLKYYCEEKESITSEKYIANYESEYMHENPVQFPFNTSNDVINSDEPINNDESMCDKISTISDEICERNRLYKDTNDWMTAYDNFENDLTIEDENSDGINYGTADPSSKISDVPCGGCGALLHCKDSGIPGYIPSEIFKNYKEKGGATLQSMVCQRCHFLKEYNVALQVRVTADDYPRILATIPKKHALVVLMVDLMDFPCSIWPGIADILGPRTPIIVVGNKVDLLPKDGKKFLNRVKQNLLNHIKLSGFGTSNILDIGLISSKTGFGVEDLITSLHAHWKYKGDVYIVGCTNVGKSSLFNALLQSDFCKVKASDLIQRATISQWPGTTLNMLKFPILRPSGHRLYLRHKRIQQQQHAMAEENRLRREQLKQNNKARYATLIGRIEQTFSNTIDPDAAPTDYFSVRGHANASGKVRLGINENEPEYAASRWCFDTPGVVQPDQIIHLLTVEELMDTIPKEIITPETFCVQSGTTVFIAGLARLDYLEGPGSVRLTVFKSGELPVTICPLQEADQLYKECLGTELFKVPTGGAERLSKWPNLESKEPFTIRGTNSKHSCNDVVLSSAGWIAINCLTDQNYKFQAWTPEKRGIYLRDSLLPEAVTLRGPRVRFSVAYKTHRFI